MRALKFLLYAVTPFIVFVLAGYLTVSILLKTQQTTVCPDIRGKTVEEAKSLVEAHDLSFSILRYERRNDVPYNRITVQKPEANISTRKGRVVYVIVSEGPELIKAPGVTGLDVENAKSILEEKKLVLDRIITVPDDKAGRVIAQVPSEKTEVLEQSKVTLFVGTRKKRCFLMPEAGDLDITDLAEEMDMKKIRYRINYARSEERMMRPGSFTLSVQAKTIFSSDDEIIINIY